MRLLPLSVFTSALAACATGDGPGALDEQLGHPRRATVAAAESTTTVHASAREPDGVDYGKAQLAVRVGSLMSHVELAPDGDDRLVIDELRLAYHDIALPASHFKRGETVADVVVSLKAPLAMPLVRTSDGAMWGAGAADMRLDWSLHVDGVVSRLLPQTLPDMEVELVISDTADGLRFDLQIVRRGVMWTWAGDVITLGEAEVLATAYSAVD